MKVATDSTSRDDRGRGMIPLSDNTLGLLLICVTRYGLGRRTYVTGAISRAIVAYAPYLSDNDLGVLLRDILKYGTQLCGEHKGLAHEWPMGIFGDARYGHHCDQEAWVVAAEALVREQERRAPRAGRKYGMTGCGGTGLGMAG